MSNYECPNCHGGFPEPGPENECPWCGQSLDKSYEHEPKVVSTVKEKEDDAARTPWLSARKGKQNPQSLGARIFGGNNE